MLDSQVMNLINTAPAGAIIAEPIKILINTWLKPKLEEIREKGKLDNQLFYDINDLFSEYINRTYNDQKSVNILALGLQQIEIEQVYIPLRILSEEKKEKITINNFDLTFIEKYKKIVIEDTAGMGKSTIMKKLFVSAIQKNIQIPIFIELRNLVSDKDIVDEIVDSINSINCDRYKRDFIRELVSRGGFIFFFDGYDEIAFQHKENVTKNLLKFISKAGNNIFFLTSRYVESLASFGQFQKFEIDAFIPDEAYELFNKYDSITDFNLAPELIKQISENIKENRFSELGSFLGNPLLVSLLYLTFKYKRDIPSSKIDFYRKVYDALYESHDLSKGSFKRNKYSNLSSRDLQKILMKLGFLCLKENTNDYSKDKLLMLINESKSSPYLRDIQEDDIFKDLIETVPLMTAVGLNYKWSHKSFMEYFAALFIDVQEKKEKILNNIYISSNFSIYLNMLDFYYEVNTELFDKIFVYPLLKIFVEYINQHVTNPIYKKLKLEYYQILFNNAFYTNYDRVFTDTDMPFEEAQEKIKNYISKNIFPKISEYKVVRTIQRSESRFDCVLVKNYNIYSLIQLLNNKNSCFIKKMTEYDNKSLSIVKPYQDFITYENTDDITENDISVTINYFKKRYCKKTTRKYNRFLLYIDYFEAIKYIKLIEDEIDRREEDIFLNL